MPRPHDASNDIHGSVRTSHRTASHFRGIPPESGAGAALQYARELLRACGDTTRCVAADAGANAAIEWARSGAMSLTGEPRSSPRFANGPIASAARGVGIALASLAPRSDLATLDAPALLGERAAIARLTRAGRSSAGGSARLLRTRDGWIALNLARAEDWRLLPAWLASDRAPKTPGEWDALVALVSLAHHEDVLARGRLLGLAVADAPRDSVRRGPGFRLAHESRLDRTNAARPLRLLDLSNLWAGPLAASLMAMTGIEVLKIESPERPDGARSGPAAFFDLMNGNKAGCALDLRDRRDRARFEQLLDHADILLESARPRALEQLGYDAASWASSKPGRLWISITGYGREAPGRNWIAYGDDAAIAAGLAWAPPVAGGTREIDESPCFCADAVADPITGLHAAAIGLAHLRAGRGGVLDLSLVELCTRVADFAAGPLAMPVESSADGRFLVIDTESEESASVAPPRARAARGAAPRLAPPAAGLLEHWSSESC